MHLFDGEGKGGHAVVASQPTSPAGRSVQAAASEHHSSDGCLYPGVGVHLSRQAVQRLVDATREASTHQPPRVEGIKDCLRSHSDALSKSDCSVSSGQHHGYSVHQQARGHSFTSSHGAGALAVRARRRLRLSRSSKFHSGSQQCPSRPRLTSRSNSPNRVEVGFDRVSLDSTALSLGQASDRLVCKPTESSAASLCLSLPRRARLGDRRVNHSTAKDVSVCLSADHNSEQVSVVGSSSDDSLPDLVGSTAQSVGNLVSAATGIGCDLTGDVASWLDGIVSTPLESLPSVATPAKATSVASRDKRLLNEGFSPKLLSRLSSSRTKSTNKVYAAKWNLFDQYCRDHNVDPYQAKSPTVADFLLFCFDTRQSSARTLQGYRSAIASVLKLSSGYDPGQDVILAQLIRSFFRERPVGARRIVPWSLNLVLRYLKFGKLAPTGLLSIRNLTLKTVFLLTLASGKRCGEIHALDSEVFKVNDSYSSVILKPRSDFLSKTHFTSRGAGTFSQIVIPSLTSDPASELQDLSLCPVKTLRVYRSHTESVRTTDQKRLIISFMPSKKNDITKQCIANYLRWLVQQAYTDTANCPEACAELDMRPHDVRGLATTLKSFTHVTMSDMLAAGVWTSLSTFLRFYCKEFTRSEITDLYALSPFVTAGSILH